jgi:uncharacterized membrane protein (UPF0127 family)
VIDVPVVPGVPVEVATTRAARRRGLLGRDGIDGVLVLVPCRQVHTFGMRFPIDVAFVARDGTVLHVTTLRPFRVTRVVWRARLVLEARAGALARWGIVPGAVVRVREHAGREP